MGHSAGAHMAALTVIKAYTDPKPPSWAFSLQSVILLAGLFDITEHYQHEQSRAVHKISKMARVFGKFYIIDGVWLTIINCTFV